MKPLEKWSFISFLGKQQNIILFFRPQFNVQTYKLNNFKETRELKDIIFENSSHLLTMTKLYHVESDEWHQ